MKVDNWFSDLDKLSQIILLIIPVVGWLVEILVRLSALIRKQSSVNIVGFVIYLIGGVFFSYIDAIYLAITDKQILIE